jgi:hypothetical protein
MEPHSNNQKTYGKRKTQNEANLGGDIRLNPLKLLYICLTYKP